MRRTLLSLSLCTLGLAAPGAADGQVRWPGRAPAVTAAGQRALDLGEALLLGASLPDRWLPQGAVLVQGAAPTRATMRALGVQHLDRALGLLPDDAHAHTLAAEAYAHLRQLPRAEQHARRALALDPRGPDAPGAWFVLALVHTLRGEHAEARDAWLAELAFPLRPAEASVVWGNLAETWVSLRQLPEAVEAFTRAVSLDPDHALAWLGLALARDRLGASPWDDARRAHDAASGRAMASRSARFALPAPRLDLDALVQQLHAEGVFFEPAYDRYAYEGIAYESAARTLRESAAPDPDAGRAFTARALAAWEAWLRDAPADDPWRDHARHRALRLRGTPTR